LSAATEHSIPEHPVKDRAPPLLGEDWVRDRSVPEKIPDKIAGQEEEEP
jgi:hypothetical protein